MRSVRAVTGCPLCGTPGAVPFARDTRREFLRCTVCGLVFVPTRYFLSADEEKKRYDLHRNSPEDEGYVRFLDRLVASLRERVSAGKKGLDFGCGPSAVLSGLFERAGYPMTKFDRFYAPDTDVFERQYDFIAACEVLEHLQQPARELDRIWSCLRPGGWLGVMTQELVPAEEFPAWSYKNDLTHVCFYSAKTFSWLAKRWKAETVAPERDVVLIRKT